MKVTRIVAKNGIYSICGNAEDAIAHLGIDKYTKLGEYEICHLDPGGMLFIHSPTQHWDIGPYKFSVQLDKASGMLALMESAKNHGPWSVCKAWACKIVMPVEIRDNVISVLHEIASSDEALHAHLDREEALADCPVIVRPNVVKEMPNGA